MENAALITNDTDFKALSGITADVPNDIIVAPNQNLWVKNRF